MIFNSRDNLILAIETGDEVEFHSSALILAAPKDILRSWRSDTGGRLTGASDRHRGDCLLTTPVSQMFAVTKNAVYELSDQPRPKDPLEILQILTANRAALSNAISGTGSDATQQLWRRILNDAESALVAKGIKP